MSPDILYAPTLSSAAEFLAERAGRQTDIPFVEQMKDMIVLKRATYITDRVAKRSADKKFFTHAFKVAILKVDKKDECSEEIPECCEAVYKTELSIPNPLRVGTHPFDYVGHLGGDKSFGWTTFGSESIFQHQPIVGKFPRHTYINDYIYVFNEPNATEIRVEGIFLDPRDLVKFNKCNGSAPCFTEESTFPIDGKILDMIIMDILNNVLRIGPHEQAQKLEVKADQNV